MYLTVSNYREEPSCIVGRIKCLRLYEVKLDEIQDYKIGNSIAFWDTIFFFQFLDDNWYKLDLSESQIYRPYIRFWNCIPSRSTGDNLRVEDNEVIGTIFEPENILKLTNYVLKNHSWLINEIREYEKRQIIVSEELKKIKALKLLLEQAVKENTLISFEYE